MIIKIFGNRTRENIMEIKRNLQDKDLQDSVSAFLNSPNIEIEESNFNNANIYKAAYCVKQFINVLINTKVTFTELNWNTYCKLMQEVSVIVRSDDASKVRYLIKLYYSFVYYDYTNIFNLNEYGYEEKYFLLSEARFGKIKDRFLLENVTTNFPLNSKIYQIHQIATEIDGTSMVNLFINTHNKLLLNLLKNFIEYYIEQDIGRRKILDINGRMFFYYFESSLTTTICSIQDFTFNSFKEQFKYFDSMKVKLNEIITLLRSFYLFLDDIYFKENGIELFNSFEFNRALLKNIWLSKYIREDYQMVYRSNFDDIPAQDKWVLIKRKEDRQAMYIQSNVSLDFTKIKNIKFRNELKEFLWYYETNDKSLQKIFGILVEFLNYASNYAENRSKVKLLSKQSNRLFTDDLILEYIAKVRVEAENKVEKNKIGFINEILGPIRIYLYHIKEFYSISELSISQIKLKETNNGVGNPISHKDVELIFQELQNVRNIDPDGEIFNIIFKLSITTKLRLGEILNLKIDCIVEKYDTYGVISYASKTSKKNKKEEFLIEDILLIEKAIKITEEQRSRASDLLKKFIFITYNRRKYKNEITHIGARYSETFTKIINELYNKNMLDNYYVPYNARDTFIDETWKMVEDNLISSLDVPVITGNTAKVAAKHYRKKDTRRYIEATYMITVGDVNVSGEIVQSENYLGELQQVEQGAGACKSNQCIKIDSENSDYQCLTCSKFITSVTRVDIFEKRLEKYTKLRNESKSTLEKDYYDGISQLYARYLEKIYEYLEDSSIG